MNRIIVFTHRNEFDLRDEVNEWLEENGHLEIISISCGAGRGSYAVDTTYMITIHYKGEEK